MKRYAERSYILLALLITAAILITCTSKIRAKAENLPVERLWGADRFKTAVDISQEGWPKGSEYVVLATGQGDDKFADALAGAPLAHALGAPILLTETNRLNADSKAEIQRLKTKFVIILGGYSVVSDNVEKDLELLGLKVERLWGPDRYGTAVKIAQKLIALKGEPSKAYLTTGAEFQYAMMIAPFAAKDGIPILFTQMGILNNDTANALNIWEKYNLEVEIIGNTSVVSKQVENRLKQIVTDVTRTGGVDMNDTNINVASSNKPDPDKVVLARDDLFADALTGAPYAAMIDAPIILVGKDSLSSKIEEYMEGLKSDDASKQVNFVALGGQAAISDSVLERIKIIMGYFLSLMRGNTPGNINNQAKIASEGDYIYYSSNLVDGYRLYKMKTDGTGMQRLNNSKSRGINVLFGWIYYINEDDDHKIYKMKTDGTENQVLNDDSSSSVNVTGDWIYYINSSSIAQGGNIVKIRTNGTGKTIVDSGGSKSLTVVDGWINFVNCDDNNNVYKMRTDGSGKVRINTDDSSYAVPDGDFIYYSVEDSTSTSLFKVGNDGSGRTQLDPAEWVSNINPSGDWIYYLSTEAVPQIYRIRKDGSGRQRLSTKWVQNVYIIGDNIYYYAHPYDPEGEFLFKMNLDGSGDTKVLGW